MKPIKPGQVPPPGWEFVPGVPGFVRQTKPQPTPAREVVKAGLELLKGEPGEKGEKGDKGEPGEPGRDGADGTPGRDGVDGAPGRDGKDGRDGVDGQKGDKGDPGLPGRDGTDGVGVSKIVSAGADIEFQLTNGTKSRHRIATIQSLGGGGGGVAGGGAGATNHGDLTGLADDDHSQYHNDVRGDARYSQLGHGHAIANVTGLQAALDGKETAGTVAAHEAAGDPHPQYLTAAEGNAAYASAGHSHNGLAPSGGTTGQVLKKNSNTDYDYSWSADATGGGGGSVTPVQVTVDFGSVPVQSKTFDVAVTGATVGQKVVASASLDMPAGVSEDEIEMDPIFCAARVLSTNTVRLVVASLFQITGQRNVNLVMG